MADRVYIRERPDLLVCTESDRLELRDDDWDSCTVLNYEEAAKLFDVLGDWLNSGGELYE